MMAKAENVTNIRLSPAYQTSERVMPPTVFEEPLILLDSISQKYAETVKLFLYEAFHKSPPSKVIRRLSSSLRFFFLLVQLAH
jgi:hypothetical protein